MKIKSAIFALLVLFPSITQAAFTRDIVFPIDGEYSFSDTFADPRSGGREHEGVDIFAAKMTPVVASVDGRVASINRPEKSWGMAIYLVDDDGWIYAYLHLNNDTPGTDDGLGGETYAYVEGLNRGDRVERGQLLGWVGDSGNAESTAPHLHFEIRDQERVAIDPYESLIAAVSADTVRRSSVEATVIIVPLGGVLVKYADNPKVYLLSENRIYHIYDEYSFETLGYNWTNIRIMPSSETYKQGLPLRFEEGFQAIYSDGTPVTLNTAPTADYNPVIFTEDLSIGSEGQQVIELQKLLKRLGHFTYPTITGYYGSVTRDAVISFQRSQGISPLGIVGPQTRAALNNLY